jgi:hypothetical protein
VENAGISVAIEDERIRDLLVGQGRHPDAPCEVIDWSAHERFDERWKTQTRSRIKRCRLVNLLDYPRLRKKFSRYDKEANQARDWVRRLGLAAVLSAALAFLALATKPVCPRGGWTPLGRLDC